MNLNWSVSDRGRLLLHILLGALCSVAWAHQSPEIVHALQCTRRVHILRRAQTSSWPRENRRHRKGHKTVTSFGWNQRKIGAGYVCTRLGYFDILLGHHLLGHHVQTLSLGRHGGRGADANWSGRPLNG